MIVMLKGWENYVMVKRPTNKIQRKVKTRLGHEDKSQAWKWVNSQNPTLTKVVRFENWLPNFSQLNCNLPFCNFKQKRKKIKDSLEALWQKSGTLNVNRLLYFLITYSKFQTFWCILFGHQYAPYIKKSQCLLEFSK
jgi:hypothetical protein